MRVGVLLLVASGCGRFGFAGLGDDDVAIDAPLADANPFDAADPIAGRVLLISMDDVPTGNGMVTSSDPSLTITCDPHCPSPVAGKRGNGYHFGPMHYFSIHRTELLTLAPFTVGFWARTTMLTSDAQDCISKPYSSTTAGNVASLWFGGGGLLTYETTGNGAANDVNNLTLTANAYDGEWHYIAAVWDGAVKRVYSDGVEAHSDESMTANVLDSSEPLEVGRDLDYGTAAHPYLGDLDELVFYNRALTPAEIAMLPAIYSD